MQSGIMPRVANLLVATYMIFVKDTAGRAVTGQKHIG